MYGEIKLFIYLLIYINYRPKAPQLKYKSDSFIISGYTCLLRSQASFSPSGNVLSCISSTICQYIVEMFVSICLTCFVHSLSCCTIFEVSIINNIFIVNFFKDFFFAQGNLLVIGFALFGLNHINFYLLPIIQVTSIYHTNNMPRQKFHVYYLTTSKV